MTKKEIIEECKQRLGFETDYEMYSLCQCEKDFYNAIIKALEQNTVSEEEYTDEYNARKQAEYELWKIKEQQPSEDCVSREQAVKAMTDWYFDMLENGEGKDFINILDALPPVTPTHGTCETCKSRPQGLYCNRLDMFTNDSFYCKGWERGEE